MATTDIYYVSGSVAGRKAAVFLGGTTDDDVQVDAFAVARVAANDTVGTLTAWINVPDITGTYTFFGCGDANVVEFLDFEVVAGKLSCVATDATTAQFVTTTNNIVLKPHIWHHVAFVQNANGLGVIIYVDGVEVPKTNSTATDVNSWFAELDGIDTARIGASNRAGDNSIVREYRGGISDLKYWSVALTAAEVLGDYKGQSNIQTSALQSHWDFDDDYVDNGLGADNGTVVGDVVLSNNYCEFASRMRWMTGTPVVADTLAFSVSNGVGHAVVIQAA